MLSCGKCMPITSSSNFVCVLLYVFVCVCVCVCVYVRVCVSSCVTCVCLCGVLHIALMCVKNLIFIIFSVSLILSQQMNPQRAALTSAGGGEGSVNGEKSTRQQLCLMK